MSSKIRAEQPLARAKWAPLVFAPAVFLTAVILVVGVGCGSTGVGNPPLQPDTGPLIPEPLGKAEQQLLDDGTESTDAGDSASAMVAIPLITLTKATHLVDADTSAAVSELSKAFFAKDCVATTRVSNVVTYKFTDCAFGPLGLLLVNGTLTATFNAKPAGAMEIVIKNEGAYTVNRATVVLNATALVSFVGDTRNVVWNGQAKILRPVKEDVDHQSSYESTYDGTCVSLDGNAKTSVGPRLVESTVTGYRRCGSRTACPAIGGRVTYAGDGRPTITIDFLGGRKARITLPKRTLDIEMKCEG